MMQHQRISNCQKRRMSSKASPQARSLLLSLYFICAAEGFGIHHQKKTWGQIIPLTRLNIYAPPGSGYAGLDDERSALPDTYEPMMEYPGTMRPGRTPENVPYQDLPIGDNDPDPVPWPHFQQIEWHHRWDAPHEHPIPMEEFIELQGRWATPEMEAAMRMGVRKGVRDRREMEESEKRETIITDDDDDDLDIPVALGDGIFGQLGSSADQAATAAATSPNRKEVEEDEEEFDDGFDDFLLDLGLDAEMEDDSDKSSKGSQKTKAATKSNDFEDDDDDDDDDDGIGLSSKSGGVTASIDVDDDSDLDLGLDDDDDLDGEDTVPLEDFGDSDTMDTEDIFDEGGFDFDDADFDMDGGDMW